MPRLGTRPATAAGIEQTRGRGPGPDMGPKSSGRNGIVFSSIATQRGTSPAATVIAGVQLHQPARRF